MSTETQDRLFGAVERRLFRATAVLFAIVALAALIGVVIWILAKTLSVFYNLVLPLSVAGILALVLYPVVDFMEHRLHVRRVLAVAILLVAFAVALSGVVFLLVPTLIQQIADLMVTVPPIVEGVQDDLIRTFPGLSAMISARMEEGGLEVMLPDLENTGQAILSYVGLAVGLSFVPLYLFFTLLSGGRLRGQATGVLSVFSDATQEKLLYLMDVFVGYVTAFFRGQLVIAVIMGAMLAAGFTLIGLNAAILIGLTLGLLNIVPFLGTLVGLIIVLPMAYFQPGGSVQLLGLCLAVFAIVQLIESWLLTPKIMADRTGLHPALVVISIFFWGKALGGVIGMILAVPLTAFVVAVWGQYKSTLTRSMLPDREADEATIRIHTGTEPGVPFSSPGCKQHLSTAKETPHVR